MKKHIIILLFILSGLIAFAQNDTTQHIIEGRKNSPEQEKKPYIILISADGFRFDYAAKYHAKHLLELSGKGVSAAFMFPAYPSVTFPNHYTIVTGSYPSHHGIVNNGFYDRRFNGFYAVNNKRQVADPKWYGGTPLWVLAEQQRMLSASFYWVASEAPIKDTKPTYYYVYNEKITIHKRIDEVVRWLELPAQSRPHFITFYLPQVDHAGHKYGPDAPETAEQVHFVDDAVNELNLKVKATGLNVNFIFISDHGMTSIDTLNTLKIPVGVDTSKFIVSGDGVLVELYAKNKKDIRSAYDNLRAHADGYNVVFKNEMPARLHYGESDDWHNRIGDIMLVPVWPRIFKLYDYRQNPGAHGYDPYLVKDMRATFYAWGPAFKNNVKIVPVDNVDIYPLVTTILGLSILEKIDGSKKLAGKALR